MSTEERINLILNNIYWNESLLPDSIWDNKDVVFGVIKQSCTDGLFECIPERYRMDRNVILALVAKNGVELCYIPEPLRNDREVVLTAINNTGQALRYASDDLRNDYDVVLAAVTQDGSALEYASKILQNNKTIVCAAVSNSEHALQYASKELRHDFDVVLTAVTRNGSVLAFVPEVLRNNKQIALSAVSSFGLSVSYTSLCDNLEIVLAAIKQDKRALVHTSKKLLLDKTFALKVFPYKVHLTNFPKEIVEDDELMIKAINYGCVGLGATSSKIRDNKAVVLIAVKNDRGELQYASERLKADREVVLTAVKFYGASILYVPLFHSDREVVITAFLHNCELSIGIPQYFSSDREILSIEVKKNGYIFKWASPELRNDRDLLYEAIKTYPSALELASAELRNNKEAIIYAAKNGCPSKYFPKWWKNDRDVALALISYYNDVVPFYSCNVSCDKFLEIQKVRQEVYNMDPKLFRDPEFIWGVLHMNDLPLIQYKIYKCRKLVRAQLPRAILDLLVALL